MADGLTRLMAPILSFTADELWRFLPGTREESVHIALFPARPSWLRWPMASCSNDGRSCWRPAKRCWRKSSRSGRTSRSAARCRRRSCCRPRQRSSHLLERYAKDLPMLFIVSEVELRSADVAREEAVAARDDRDGRAASSASGAGGTCQGLERPGLGRPVRAVPGCAFARRSSGVMDAADDAILGEAQAVTMPPRRLEIWLPILIVDARSAHEGDRPIHAAAACERHDHSWLAGFHARAEHGRRVRHSQRVELSVQDGPDCADRAARARRRRHVRGQPGAPSDRGADRAGAHHRRRRRQPDRSRRRRIGRRFRRRVLADVSFLGVQRRRLGDYGRRRRS